MRPRKGGKELTRGAFSGKINIRRMSVDDTTREFKCSKPEFEEYLAVHALYDQTHQVGQPYVFDHEGQIVGYIVLSMDRLDEQKEVLGIDTFGNIPALLVGRLATDARYERRGIGRFMMRWAVAYASRLSRIVGCRVVLVNSEPDVVGFYEKIKFKKITREDGGSDTIDMYLDIKDV